MSKDPNPTLRDPSPQRGPRRDRATIQLDNDQGQAFRADVTVEAGRAKRLYVAEVTSHVGRQGRLTSASGFLDVRLDLPQALTGRPAKGTNPEELLAGAYASCFLSSMQLVASEGHNLQGVNVTAAVSLLQESQGTFCLGVELRVALPMLTREQARRLVLNAHKVCPFSRATQGNVEVTILISEAQD